MLKLIREDVPSVEVLEEDVNGKKFYYLEGVFMQSEVKNRNGRIYPKGVMESAVSRYLTEKVATKSAYGELGHPQGPKINEDRISHRITKLDWDGNDVVGRAVIIPQGNGLIAQGILETGGRLGMSSRGLGSLLKKDGAMYVQEDFYIATAADIVTDPSAPKAWVNGILENTEFWYDAAAGTWGQRVVEQTHEKLKKMSVREIEEKRVAMFETFMRSLTLKS